MLDFITIKKKDKNTVIFPDFKITSNKGDLMTKGKDFYAVWDEEKGLWSTKETDVQRLVDKELWTYNAKYENEYGVSTLTDFSSGEWDRWIRYKKHSPDQYTQLDTKIIFENTETRKEDYASHKLNYPITQQDTPYYNKLMTTLYDPTELLKLEWSIGCIIKGDSKRLQKFFVLYGPPGAGKGTFLEILTQLFDGYCASFVAKDLGASKADFALEAFRNNPLIAYDPDGDLSKIETNTRLNSIVSHEVMLVNEKFKSKYEQRFHSMLYICSNDPVKITDAKSGLTRRLIDVSPSDRRLNATEYFECLEGVKYELGGIAQHCLDIYEELGFHYYDKYVAINMISATNDIYNYVVDNLDSLDKGDVLLRTAWALYKEYTEYANLYQISLKKFKEELKAYYRNYEERRETGEGIVLRSVYSDFRYDKVDIDIHNDEHEAIVSDTWLDFRFEDNSIFDLTSSEFKAQLANTKGTPTKAWKNNTTVLSEIDTRKLHFVKVPENHIVIDFDIKGPDGKKNLDLNIKAASKFPETYAELSKSGAGIHLHYIYDGDVTKLSRIYDTDIEVKVFTGDSSLRRQLTKCVNKQISHISSGLPFKEDIKVVTQNTIKDAKQLTYIISKCLVKDYDTMPYTNQNVAFIKKLLDDAYESGMKYDITPMRPAIYAFCANSTNQAEKCLKTYMEMKWHSDVTDIYVESKTGKKVFFDVEVFINVFIICWKFEGEDVVHRMINPKPYEVEALFDYDLIGFNNLNYDNHILWAAHLGYSTEQLYNISQRIINNSPNAKFNESLHLSYTDIYDFASAGNKKSLKKYMIELGIDHIENAHPWDKPLEEKYWDEVTDYCCNDVKATEVVFNHLQADYKSRCALAKMAGGTPNDRTNALSLKFVFGDNKHPDLVYTDLNTGIQSEESYGLPKPLYPNAFPGYEYIPGPENKGKGRNMFRGVDLGFGGYVAANPGMYGPTKTYDVAGMHPASIRALNMFGKYTERFAQIVELRLCIKHGDLEKAKTYFDGALAEYFDDPEEAKAIANALKTVVNSMYGLTSANFENPARDSRNVNNICALRGALFMKTLQDEVEAMGYTVVHIKTDSIKVANPDEKIEKFIFEFGKKYGYEFEIEHDFSKICLVNNAVYIAEVSENDSDWVKAKKKSEEKGLDIPTRWTATGTQFKVPYIFKTLFSKEPVYFEDYCETKSVKSAMYLDFNESDLDTHNYTFVGRVGSFVPIKPGYGGGELLRDAGLDKDGNVKYSSVTGCKGYRWMESAVVRSMGREDDVDISYWEDLANEAIKTINEFGDFWVFSYNDPF